MLKMEIKYINKVPNAHGIQYANRKCWMGCKR